MRILAGAPLLGRRPPTEGFPGSFPSVLLACTPGLSARQATGPSHPPRRDQTRLRRGSQPQPWPGTAACSVKSFNGRGHPRVSGAVCGCFCSDTGGVGGRGGPMPRPMKPKTAALWPFTGEPEKAQPGRLFRHKLSPHPFLQHTPHKDTLLSPVRYGRG